MSDLLPRMIIGLNKQRLNTTVLIQQKISVTLNIADFQSKVAAMVDGDDKSHADIPMQLDNKSFIPTGVFTNSFLHGRVRFVIFGMMQDDTQAVGCSKTNTEALVTRICVIVLPDDINDLDGAKTHAECLIEMIAYPLRDETL